jgi:mono/diheme cytochrome c family protein
MMPDARHDVEGEAIFKGKGNCSSCHASTGTGTRLGPDLTDDEWLHIDGSYEAIVALVRKGVPKPKEAPVPMAPLGGAALTDSEVVSVARYVYGLSH